MKKLITLEDYVPLIGREAADRIQEKGRKLGDTHVVHVSSTYYGGGVSTLLSSLTLLMNGIGVKTGWRIIQGAPDFFSVTKKLHNALQGGEIDLTERKTEIYEEVNYENSIRNHLDHDVVIVHDPQPMPLIGCYRRKGPWIWRCHVDLTRPDPAAWDYLRPFAEKYDAAIVSLDEYKRPDLKIPQMVFYPAIDPFCITNKELSEEDIKDRFSHYDIPTDLPLVVQVSRFDKWKDPEGVIEAFKKARKEVDCTLVLVGNVATDDPEGEEMYDKLTKLREERIIILSAEDTALVNALQRKAAVVLQKSIREGFGLTVAEAMWKGTPVIGGNVGGIKHQIQDGENGFLVSSPDEAADRIVRLLKDPDLCSRIGKKGKETVKERFLMTRLLESYLDLFLSFRTTYTLKK
ncbi:MAG: glycosyltransferase [Elusimicrobiales bacterium]|nr:glycosyltransferase [Elusimicrobiales bacterium]